MGYYEATTVQEAIRAWQRDALHHISVVARHGLGIDIEMADDRWIESGKEPGYFTKRGQRDRIVFIPYATDKIVRKLGEVNPVGEQKNELLVVDEAGPNDYDSEETLSWRRGTSLNLVETTSETHGWSALVKLGFEAGSQNNKITGGIELGTHGDYSKSKAEDKGQSLDASHSTTIKLPKGEMARLLQTVRTGRAEVEVEDLIVLRLGFKVGDYKKRVGPNRSRLDHHAGYRGINTSKSRWHWDCPDTNDFRTMVEGNNPRYPNVPGDWSEWQWKSINWLLDEGNRTLRVRSKAIFDQGVWGNSRVQRLDDDDHVLSEEDAIG